MIIDPGSVLLDVVQLCVHKLLDDNENGIVVDRSNYWRRVWGVMPG